MDTRTSAEAFERHRVHLTGVAYRMLGTLTDAEDAVQEAYLRFARAKDTELRDVRAWLTTAVARICLDEQLVARARTHARRRAPRFTPDRGQHASAVEAFLTACSHGSVQELVRVLDPDVVLRSDGGGLVPGVARRPVTGSDNVARLLLGVAARHTATTHTHTVNGSTGLIFETGGAVVGVMGFTVAGNLITEIDFVVNPEKLRRVTRR